MSDSRPDRIRRRPVPWLLRIPGLRRYGVQLTQARRRIESLRARLLGLRSRLISDCTEFARRTQDHKSRQLTPDVPRQVLAPRHLAIVASSARQAAAVREMAFLQHSSAYSDTVRRDSTASGLGTQLVTIEGLSWRIPVDAASNGGLSYRIVREGWRPLDAVLTARELALGTAMIDVGANVGTSSIPRVVLGDFAYVYAAEPDPANFMCLVDNITANGLQGFVLLDRVAIGAANGEAVLRRRTQIGTHYLVSTASRPTDISVQVCTLDSRVARLGIDVASVTFIKGWEVQVLRSAARLLAQHHIAWQIEFSPRLLERAGSSSADLLERAEAHFTHFIDLGAHVTPRSKPMSQFREAVASLERRERRYTDLLFYNARPR